MRLIAFAGTGNLGLRQGTPEMLCAVRITEDYREYLPQMFALLCGTEQKDELDATSDTPRRPSRQGP